MPLLDADEREIVKLVADFVDKRVRPVVRELEHSNTYPEQLIEEMKAMGVYGLAIPAPYGDFGVSTSCYALVTEELARGWMSLAGAFGGHSVVSKLLLKFGTEEQKHRYLPRLSTGELRATMALTEPGGWFGPAGHADIRPPRRRHLCRERLEDLDQQRPQAPV